MPPPGSSMGALASLVAGELVGDPATTVTDATHDSQRVPPGSLFIAITGARFDGHDFAAGAVAAGARAVCVTRRLPLEVPQLMVTDTRKVMGPLAARIHGDPSLETTVIGVTGTNGKTTVTHMIEGIADTAGRRCGLIGTIATRLGSQTIENPRTTPEATDFQRVLRFMVDQGASLVACEVSSHSLTLGRVDATRFAVGAFTNLSQDHLDFHGSMDSYLAAKASLLERAEQRVIWIEDPAGAQLATRFPDTLRVGGNGEVWASSIESDVRGSRFVLHLPDGEAASRISLPGRFNLANALVAAGCCHFAGFSLAEIAGGLESLPSVPGRFEIVSGSHPVMVVVDYAHTPDGIGNVIATARSLARGRVLAVIGAGGDRDRAKRPAMGKAASGADLVVLTSDNPRSEDPEAIIDQLMAGVDNPAVVRITDRRQAISTALAAAAAGDIVLILGKGHEQGQEAAGVVQPFDDREVAREVLAEVLP
jgi:UDP-N-acetylmuramoyl-L-alanyl-D-glutamate--2,6-diaminopimelate ligase